MADPLPTIRPMFEAMKTVAQRSVMERLVLFVNHVVAAEPAALERLRPHAGRTMTIEVVDWPTLLPPIGPLAFRVTPAGLLEWEDDAGAGTLADLRVAVVADNPAALLGRLITGDRPAVTVSGDAAFASDLDWLIDNLRWDAQDDLARFVGDAPARELARFGGFIAAGFRDAAKALRDLAGRGDPGQAADPPRR